MENYLWPGPLTLRFFPKLIFCKKTSAIIYKKTRSVTLDSWPSGVCGSWSRVLQLAFLFFLWFVFQKYAVSHICFKMNPRTQEPNKNYLSKKKYKICFNQGSSQNISDNSSVTHFCSEAQFFHLKKLQEISH